MREIETDKLVVEFLEKQGVVKHIDLNYEDVVKSLAASDTQPAMPTGLYGHNADMATNIASFIQTVKIKKQNHPHSPVKNLRLFYSTNIMVHSENVGLIINAVNRQEIERASNLSDTERWQKNISVLTSYSENEVTLMHRFVKDRALFFDNNKMLGAEEITSILGYGAGNPRRTVSELINQNKLIAFKQEGRFLAPEFQFNAKAALYPELQAVIVAAKDKGFSHLELAMWLSRSRRFILGYQRKTTDWSGQIFSDVLQKIEEQSHNDVEVFDGKPIDILAKGDLQLFDILVTQWLEPHALEHMHGIIVNE